MTKLAITSGRVLLACGELASTALRIEDGYVAALDGGVVGDLRIDADGLLVLPGIVDLHGDAFERQLQPRPGVAFAAALALRDTEAQLLANGITTALHAVTLSWEPGLRSPVAWGQLLDALDALRPRTVCDMRVHMRWELHNLDALAMALADIEAGRVHLLSFNDHTPSILRKLEKPGTAAKYSERAGMSVAEFRGLAERAFANDPHVPQAAARLAEAARRHGLPIASHDDDSIPVRDRYRALGARICEFPMAEDVAIAAREAGDAVVMGAPNVVRGHSHLGWASAAVMAERDVCTVLCSDYYYPAMLGAAFALAGRGVLGLAEAWALVSANPAAAAGLQDRGSIEVGKRADLVLVDPEGPTIVATVAAGRIGWMSRAGWERTIPGCGV
ncbi:MAG: alpha-D-ribose 1-methylphosphonate 5-triphosphate diphosphatase [Acetobacteraceae bacterium]|nr:alpha-D-ribose 1-methylphosphonate 5-triphosphate diphosphatase [Acetobacteraceae bacterium]